MRAKHYEIPQRMLRLLGHPKLGHVLWSRVFPLGPGKYNNRSSDPYVIMHFSRICADTIKEIAVVMRADVLDHKLTASMSPSRDGQISDQGKTGENLSKLCQFLSVLGKIFSEIKSIACL